MDPKKYDPRNGGSLARRKNQYEVETEAPGIMGSVLMAWLIGGGGAGMILGLVEPLHTSGSMARDRYRAAEILKNHRGQLSKDERQFADDLWNRVKPSDAARIDLRHGV